MAVKKPAPQITQPKVPLQRDLEPVIRRLAQEGEVSFGAHVFERKEQRNITLPDALEVLRLGNIVGPIEAGANVGEWKCKMVARMEIGRSLGVVTIVIGREHLFLKTVEWED